MVNYKVAFIGWNPFQFIHIKELAKSIPNSVFILERRKNNIDKFSKEILENKYVPIIILGQKDIQKLDGKYDILITQTVFEYLHTFRKTKIVMLQYSYAKEPHQYGIWRVLADLTLVYGDYAAKRISNFCPISIVGNPRYDVYNESSFHDNAKLLYGHMIDKNKKTILYMPTWGELSSIDTYLESIAELSSNYNLLIKLHHNTDIMEKDRVNKVNCNNIHVMGANDDALALLSISDIVISDYSGAIFDAIYCKKPVLLLDLEDTALLTYEKMDEYSLEFRHRNILGLRVNDPSEFLSKVKYIENNYEKILKKTDKIRRILFKEDSSAKERIKQSLNDLMSGKYHRTQSQQYLWEALSRCYSHKNIKQKLIRLLKKYYLL